MKLLVMKINMTEQAISCIKAYNEIYQNPKMGMTDRLRVYLLVQKIQKTKRVDMKKIVRPEPGVTPHEFHLRSLTRDLWYVCWLKA